MTEEQNISRLEKIFFESGNIGAQAFQLAGIGLAATGVRYGWFYVTLGTILDIGVALHQSSLHYKKNEMFPYSGIKYSKIFPYKLLMPE